VQQVFATSVSFEVHASEDVRSGAVEDLDRVKFDSMGAWQLMHKLKVVIEVAGRGQSSQSLIRKITAVVNNIKKASALTSLIVLLHVPCPVNLDAWSDIMDELSKIRSPAKIQVLGTPRWWNKAVWLKMPYCEMLQNVGG
jgi:hypothetical protein